MISECDKWVFFTGSLEYGKKNDHVTHRANLEYIIKYYDEKKLIEGNEAVKYNYVFSDNCNAQYKCIQNVAHLASFHHEHKQNGVIEHRFAQKYGFKCVKIIIITIRDITKKL